MWKELGSIQASHGLVCFKANPCLHYLRTMKFTSRRLPASINRRGIRDRRRSTVFRRRPRSGHNFPSAKVAHMVQKRGNQGPLPHNQPNRVTLYPCSVLQDCRDQYGLPPIWPLLAEFVRLL
jgi:hypothetical protein